VGTCLHSLRGVCLRRRPNPERQFCIRNSCVGMSGRGCSSSAHRQRDPDSAGVQRVRGCPQVPGMGQLSLHPPVAGTPRLTQFCLLYLTSSIFNLLRSLLLIAVTVAIAIAEDGDNDYSWLFVYIYSFADLPVLVIYFFGFTTRGQAKQLDSTLLEAAPRLSNSSQSRR
jgi:hypothetical protein